MIFREGGEGLSLPFSFFFFFFFPTFLRKEKLSAYFRAVVPGSMNNTRTKEDIRLFLSF